MAKYNKAGNIFEVANPELNQDLIAGATLVDDTTPLGKVADTTTPSPSFINPNFSGTTTGGQYALNSTNLSTQGSYTPTYPTDTTNFKGMINGMASSDWLKNAYAVEQNQPKITDTFKQLYSELGLEQYDTGVVEKNTAFQTAKNELDMINAELQALKTEADAVPLRLQEEATGRGITAGGLAPLQAGELRKVALKAIPLQAQAYVAQAKALAAQGDLESAERARELANTRFTTLFNLQAQQEERDYNYRKEMRDTIYNDLTRKEQQQIDYYQTLDNRKYEESKTNRNQQDNWVKTAIEMGQGSLASKIASLDSKSDTFGQDLSNLIGQIQQPSTYTTFTQNGVTYQGQKDPISGMIKEETIKPLVGGETKTTFTNNQINKGASTIGVSIGTFSLLPEDTKNVIINNTDFTDNFKLDLDDIASGALDKQTVIDDLINTSALSPEAKQGLIQIVNSISSPAKVEEKTKSNFWGDVWSGIKSIATFGIMK